MQVEHQENIVQPVELFGRALQAARVSAQPEPVLPEPTPDDNGEHVVQD